MPILFFEFFEQRIHCLVNQSADGKNVDTNQPKKQTNIHRQ